MEFDLEQLRRDWIEGVSGEDFYARVMAIRASPERRPAGYIIREEDPIAFCEKFFAAVSMGRPTVLASPAWGLKEEAQFVELISDCDFRPGSILIPTGGTTGGVKLAMHDWRSLCASAHAVQSFLGGGPIDSCCVLPLYHVSGLMQLVRSYVTGGCIRFHDTEVAGCCLSYVPTQLQRALQDVARVEKLKSARVIFVGGAGMSEKLAAEVRAWRLPVMPVYGMTETAAMCAAVPVEDFLNGFGAGALPLGDTQFSMEPDGRIRVESSALFQGYQGGDPLDLAEGYLTGDLGELDAAGRLHVLGRADQIIITGGEKVDPAEVECSILEMEGIVDAAVIGVPDSEWGQRVVGYYVHGAGAELENWREDLSAKLAKYKLPKQLIRLDKLPRDGRGKLVLSSLRSLAIAT